MVRGLLARPMHRLLALLLAERATCSADHEPMPSPNRACSSPGSRGVSWRDASCDSAAPRRDAVGSGSREPLERARRLFAHARCGPPHRLRVCRRDDPLRGLRAQGAARRALSVAAGYCLRRCGVHGVLPGASGVVGLDDRHDVDLLHCLPAGVEGHAQAEPLHTHGGQGRRHHAQVPRRLRQQLPAHHAASDNKRGVPCRAPRRRRLGLFLLRSTDGRRRARRAACQRRESRAFGLHGHSPRWRGARGCRRLARAAAGAQSAHDRQSAAEETAVAFGQDSVVGAHRPFCCVPRHLCGAHNGLGQDRHKVAVHHGCSVRRNLGRRRRGLPLAPLRALAPQGLHASRRAERCSVRRLVRR
eukprot:Amastigsp_a841716_145.p3 type:complete len:359 gc:universal Amastigsp_a841716_145:154-1230(+)